MSPAGCQGNCDGIAWLTCPVAVLLVVTVSMTWCCCRRKRRYVDGGGDDACQNNKRPPPQSRQDASRSTPTNNNGDAEEPVGVKERIRALEGHQPVTIESRQAQKRQKPNNKAFEQFENSGVIIGLGGAGVRKRDDDDESSIPGQPPSEGSREQRRNSVQSSNEDDIFADVSRNTQVLKSFRRAPPPRKRGRVTRPAKHLTPDTRTLAPEPAWATPEIRVCVSVTAPPGDQPENRRFQATPEIHVHDAAAAAAPAAPPSGQPESRPEDFVDAKPPGEQPENNGAASAKRPAAVDGGGRPNTASPVWCLRQAVRRPTSCDVTPSGDVAASRDVAETATRHKARLNCRMQRYATATTTATTTTEATGITTTAGDANMRKWQSERSSLHQTTPATGRHRASALGAHMTGQSKDSALNCTKRIPMETEI